MDTQASTGDAVLVKSTGYPCSKMTEQVGDINSRAGWREEGLSRQKTNNTSTQSRFDHLLHHYFNGLLVLFLRSGWLGLVCCFQLLAAQYFFLWSELLAGRSGDRDPLRQNLQGEHPDRGIEGLKLNTEVSTVPKDQLVGLPSFEKNTALYIQPL